MTPFPSIETDRLLLTELRATDIPDIVQHASNERISEFTLNLPFPYSEKDAIYWINMAHQGFQKGTNVVFAIRLKPEHPFIGGIGLTIDRRHKRGEIGYWIAEPYWHNGFATEATKALLPYGFDLLDLNKFTASYFTGNPASGKVMRNCGMSKEGELKGHLYKNERFHDVIIYGLTRQQYLEQKHSV